MNLQQAINSGKKFKRAEKGMWLKVVNGRICPEEAMLDYVPNTEDILADDWEIEEEKPDTIKIVDRYGDLLEIYKNSNRVYFEIIMKSGNLTPHTSLSEENIDELLTFLYNNTEIGKKRVIPF